MPEIIQKPIVWLGSSHKILKSFPLPVQKDMGYALWIAQIGGKHHNAKPLKGFRGVMEIVSDFKTDAYRAIYAVKLGEKIYVLHTFQKKSTQGISTPKHEMNIIQKRLQEALKLSQENRR